MTDLRTALEELVRVTTRFAVYGYGDLRVGKHLDVARAALAQSDDGKQAALEVAQRHGGTDGDHHKAWVIDQMVRALTGDGYDKFVTDTINQANTRLSVENKRLRAALAQSDDGKQAALEVAQRHGGTDGDHHKAWVIDQMVRALTGDGYDQFVADTCAGEEGPDSYFWGVGIAP